MSPMLNGSHDVGGSRAFGAVTVDDEHGLEDWERSVFGTTLSALAIGLCTIEDLRTGIEQLPAVVAVELTYWHRWMQSLERALRTNGVLAAGEVEARTEAVSAGAAPDAPPDGLARVDALLRNGLPDARPANGATPRFGRGDRVRTHSILVDRPGEGHTRLPGYLQGRAGTIDRTYPPAALPDVRKRAGDRPEHVYAVRFDARALWPDVDAGHTVSADLWESYLEAA